MASPPVLFVPSMRGRDNAGVCGGGWRLAKWHGCRPSILTAVWYARVVLRNGEAPLHRISEDMLMTH